MKVVINGVNSNSAGGLSVLSNILKCLPKAECHNDYYLITSVPELFSGEEYSFLNVLKVSDFWSKTIIAPVTYEFYLNKIINDIKADAVLNLGDLIIKTKVPQIYLFDWSYAIYPESRVWDTMSVKDKLNRYSKLALIKKNINSVDIIAAQTISAENRLRKYFNVENIELVPNAVSLENLQHFNQRDFSLPQKKRLLYLTRYYPHKNIEIVLPVARLIRDRNLDYCVVLTISDDQHPNARALIRKIKEEKLDSILINIGPVNRDDVPAIYAQCDGLLMPTLLESFSGTYVEAMHHKIPIFTSKIDFAQSVCGDYAFYFDQDCPEDIISTINKGFIDKGILESRVNSAYNHLSTLDSWESSTKKLINIIARLV